MYVFNKITLFIPTTIHPLDHFSPLREKKSCSPWIQYTRLNPFTAISGVGNIPITPLYATGPESDGLRFRYEWSHTSSFLYCKTVFGSAGVPSVSSHYTRRAEFWIGDVPLGSSRFTSSADFGLVDVLLVSSLYAWRVEFRLVGVLSDSSLYTRRAEFWFDIKKIQ